MRTTGRRWWMAGVIGAAACGVALGAEPGRTRIVVHGGAGVLEKKELTPEVEKEFRTDLEAAVRAGDKVLQAGGTSLEAVAAAIVVLEDSPRFNAGRGAVFTNTGAHELDASLMDGRTGLAGAVARVQHVKNPIRAARLVMEKTKHVLLAGDGAEELALQHGLELVPQTYFDTDRRWRDLQRAKEEEQKRSALKDPRFNFGTVGAVALDKDGHVAAGTSTGGMTNKRYGRIGDSPIIGAGTYANDGTCAVSCTGHGEYFIRHVVAYDVAALVEYKGLSLQAAADEVVKKKLVKAGGEGGLIAVNRTGDIAISFNSDGMYRAYLDADGKLHIGFFGE